MNSASDKTVSNDFPEIRFNVLADDEHHFIEARFQRIVYGIIHDDLSGRSHPFQLLDAAEPGTDSRRQNHQRIFPLHVLTRLSVGRVYDYFCSRWTAKPPNSPFR